VSVVVRKAERLLVGNDGLFALRLPMSARAAPLTPNGDKSPVGNAVGPASTGLR
jgi:hypothetical protein